MQHSLVLQCSSWLNNLCTIFHIWLIHLSVDGHLGCFHFEAVMSNATISTWVRVFLSGQMFSMTMRIFLEVELLVPIEILFLTSWGTAKPFSTVAPTIYISTAMQKSSNGFSSSATFWAFWDKVSCSTSWPWTPTLASRVEGLRHKLPCLDLTNSYNCRVFLPVGHPAGRRASRCSPGGHVL